MNTSAQAPPTPAPVQYSRTARTAAAAAAAVLAAILIAVTGATGASAQPPTPTAPVTPTPATPTPTTPPSRWVTPPSTTPTPASPNPTTPGTPTPPPTPGSGSGSAECGVTNINGCVQNAIDGFLQRIVESALNPLLELLSETLLTTPEPGQIPEIGVLWNQSWQLVTALYVLVVMAAGVLLMTRETLQTQWSIRELAPRLVVGFVTGGLSMMIATAALGFANALAGAVAGDGVDSASAADALAELAVTSQSHGFFLLLHLALVVMLLVLLISYVIRVSITIVLIVAAPLALMCHALPGIDGVARWWWRSFAACLAIQVAQSLTLVTVLRVLLAPGGWHLFGPNANEIADLTVALALMYVLIKTPMWLLSVLNIGQGRSFARSIARGFLAYKTLGLLKGATSSSVRTAASAAPARRGPRPARAPRTPRPAAAASSGSADPFARVRSTRDGQLMLPLDGVRRVARQPSSTPADSTGTPPPRPPRTPRGRQLAFDFTPPDPYRGIRAGAGGQYPLPIPVRRVRPTPPAPAPPPQRPSPRRRPEQLAFDFTEPTPADPYARLRPTRSGQYPLPFPVTRVKPIPPPPNPPQPPAPAPARPAGRQLHLPMPDLPVRRRAPRAPRGGTLR
ncbi:hypothetical protein ABZV58_31045 [Nocardia sp. NPDC004654]|uniref:hypothetical protein n=1 Tax=Nocardia sp. NPDC004654 TaxID=3154776 RepID=UPI0033A8AA8C